MSLQVDDVLEGAKPCGDECGWCEFCRMHLLADEIRRLRSELAMSKPVFSRRQLEARLARVEALPTDWRKRIGDMNFGLASQTAKRLLLELEASLKDQT